MGYSVIGKHEYLKFCFVFDDGWAGTQNRCVLYVYVSHDGKVWEQKNTFYKLAGDSNHMSILHNFVGKNLVRYVKESKIDPEVVIVEVANLAPYLFLTKTIGTYGLSRADRLRKTIKRFNNMGTNGARVVVKLGDLTKESYETFKHKVRLKAAVMHFEDSGVPTNDFCESEVIKRQQLGLWKDGN